MTKLKVTNRKQKAKTGQTRESLNQYQYQESVHAKKRRKEKKKNAFYKAA